jgi:hypothetical protein
MTREPVCEASPPAREGAAAPHRERSAGELAFLGDALIESQRRLGGRRRAHASSEVRRARPGRRDVVAESRPGTPAIFAFIALWPEVHLPGLCDRDTAPLEPISQPCVRGPPRQPRVSDGVSPRPYRFRLALECLRSSYQLAASHARFSASHAAPFPVHAHGLTRSRFVRIVRSQP